MTSVLSAWLKLNAVIKSCIAVAELERTTQNEHLGPKFAVLYSKISSEWEETSIISQTPIFLYSKIHTFTSLMYICLQLLSNFSKGSMIF